MLFRAMIDTPVGPMVLITDRAGALWAAEFHADPTRVDTSVARFAIGPTVPADAPHPAVADAFASYFAGHVDALCTLDLPPLGSDFERAVWAALRRIPAGQTRSYGDIARALGGAAGGRSKPGAAAAGGPSARAVGTANSRNPRAIAVPCHRVVGADGRLTGYAGGLSIKAWLLAHEGAPMQQAML